MNAVGQFVPLILIFAIMWFLLIRPQQKKMKEHKAMAKVKEGDEIEVEIAQGVKARLVKSTVTQVLSKTEPAES